MTQAAQSATALFRQHAGSIARFVVRYGVEPADVDDVVQEVFLIAHAHGGYRPGPAKPTSWLAAIAVRVASSHRRRLRTRAFARGQRELVERPPARRPAPRCMRGSTTTWCGCMRRCDCCHLSID